MNKRAVAATTTVIGVGLVVFAVHGIRRFSNSEGRLGAQAFKAML